MSDALKHECGIAHIRLLKPLDYYKKNPDFLSPLSRKKEVISFVVATDVLLLLPGVHSIQEQMMVLPVE